MELIGIGKSKIWTTLDIVQPAEGVYGFERNEVMKKNGIDTKLQRIFCLFSMVLFSMVCTGTSELAAQIHSTISEYKGPSTCVECHQIEAEDMFGSVHYQWSGPTPNVTNISGDAGKAN